MALHEIFSHPEVRVYKSTLVSKATFFLICCVILTFVAPLLSVYRAYGFWKKEDFYTEQPVVRFKYQALLILSTSTTQWTWSTMTNLNALQQENLLAVQMKVMESDSNLDGKYESLLVQIEAPLASGENILAAKLILLFDYKLSKLSDFTMQSMAYIDYSSSQSGASLSATGQLSFKQKTPLKSSGIDVRYNDSVIPSTSVVSSDYQLSKIFLNYQQRNVTTMFDNALYVWETGRPTGEPFRLNATVYYPPARVLYLTGFWHLIKWAWVQYVPLLLVFLFVFDRIKVFVFQNQIIGTLVQRPKVPCKQHDT
ncbi:hypothetical protein BOX15_Mlig007303g2 [Macrostomum lignano]|uniref:Transmembrane protein 231 n=1 Tax=Macrostomum lignano TaxID=282301 RepID=A0A267E1F8_9PLAT|nr:hypothetical protein BOX15_Mlig007303g2 [Macrostomum lignano]